MFEVIAVSSLLKLGFAFIALGLVWGVLRGLDYLMGLKFKTILNGSSSKKGIRDDSIAIAIYFSIRFLGTCILVGWVIS